MDTSTDANGPTNLRHFRFQKKPSIQHSNGESSQEGCEPSQNGNKPVVIDIDLVDTEDEDDACEQEVVEVVSPAKEVPTVEEEPEPDPPFNEMGFIGLKQYFKSVDPQIIEKCLIRAKGDCVKAKKYIREEACGYPRTIDINTMAIKTIHPITSSSVIKSDVTERNTHTPRLNSTPIAKQNPANPASSMVQIQPAKKRTLSSENGVKREKHYKRIKKVVKEPEFNALSGSESDGMDGGFSNDHRVFDSDEDSETEVSGETTSERQQVLEFLSNGTLSELLCMPQISKKKAELIVAQRPFENWKDMVDKFQESKGLGTEVLNSASEFLYTRHVVTQLMNKCSKLSAQLERANFSANMAVKTYPSLLNQEKKLAGYQMIGLNWLVMLRDRGLNGILADEMGLGKTVQVIAFLARLKEMEDIERRKPHLIVVPSSTLDNWGNELDLWCPSLKVSVYYGSQEERQKMRIQYARGGVKEHDVVLTTYNLLTASPAERKMFRVLDFDYVVFDEAHMLKNMNTVRYEHLSNINAKRRILLTGTPLQNNLLELMSLLTFVMPDLFYNKKEYLKCLFARNATRERNENANAGPDALPRFEQQQISQAKKIMKPFVLRRLKKDVLKDLPIKTEDVRSCSMSERQRNLYDSLISKFSKSAVVKTEDEAPGKSMTMMMTLRKVSNHPMLIRDQYTEHHVSEMAKLLVNEPTYQEKNLDYVKEDLSILSDFELHGLCQAYKSIEKFALSDDYILDSGKFKVLDDLMEEFEQDDHRVLIFSQFVIMLNVLEKYMEIRGHKYLRLDGSTAVPLRQELIDEFNQDSSIKAFLLSTRAGGLGINLTAADTVVIHDIDFNPYNDKQAEDRCHRVGQTRPVTIYRLISENSIEEDIYQIATEKLYLEKELSADDSEAPEERVETKWLLKKALGLEKNALPYKS